MITEGQLDEEREREFEGGMKEACNGRLGTDTIRPYPDKKGGVV